MTWEQQKGYAWSERPLKKIKSIPSDINDGFKGRFLLWPMVLGQGPTLFNYISRVIPPPIGGAPEVGIPGNSALPLRVQCVAGQPPLHFASLGPL